MLGSSTRAMATSTTNAKEPRLTASTPLSPFSFLGRFSRRRSPASSIAALTSTATATAPARIHSAHCCT